MQMPCRMKPDVAFTPDAEIAPVVAKRRYEKISAVRFPLREFERYESERLPGFFIARNGERPFLYVTQDAAPRRGYVRLATQAIEPVTDIAKYCRDLNAFRRDFHDLHAEVTRIATGGRGDIVVQLIDREHPRVVERWRTVQPSADGYAPLDADARVFFDYLLGHAAHHFGDVLKDTDAAVWLVKQPKPNPVKMDMLYDIINSVDRETLAYRMGKDVINIAEVRRDPGFGNKGRYGVKAAIGYTLDDLLHKNARDAESAMVVYEVFTHRFDPHWRNFSWIEGVPLTFDYDAGFNPRMPWHLFCMDYLVELAETPFRDRLNRTRLDKDHYNHDVIRQTIGKLEKLDIDGIVGECVILPQEQHDIGNFLKRNQEWLERKVGYLLEYITHDKFKEMSTDEIRNGGALAEVYWSEGVFAFPLRHRR